MIISVRVILNSLSQRIDADPEQEPPVVARRLKRKKANRRLPPTHRRRMINLRHHLCLLANFILFLSLLALADGFTCQGNTYDAALKDCPDKGSQKLSAGGNVTVLVKTATNLPNRDFTGTSAGVSDPYVKLTVGSVSAKTRTIYNNLNPEWNERLNIGVLGSATAITIEIWDEDTGMEFGDDLIARTIIRVPFCSTFSANYTRQTCRTVFGCEVDDSLWKQPYRQLCNETDFVAFSQAT